MKQNDRLKSLIKEAEKLLLKSAWVFDLDSTLFSTKWRTKQIIDDAVKQLDSKNSCKDTCQKLLNTELEEKDWSLSDVFKRHNLSLETDTAKYIQKYWDEYFFKDKYLNFDKPYPQASEFVQALDNAGACVYYLTARKQASMQEGTLKSLKRWGFPLQSQECLFLKPKDPLVSDSDFKVSRMEKICRLHDQVNFFENEPVILHGVHLALPQVRLFWMRSIHSGQMNQAPHSAISLSTDYAFQ